MAALNSSSMLSTRMMPASRKTASQTASSPASEPVWLAAASAPCGVRPDLIARIGLAPVAAGDPPGRLDQPPPVAQLLQVQQDHVGLLVLVQVVEQLDLGHAGLVAEADELGEADLLLPGVVEHGRAQCPRLAEEGDPPGVRASCGRRRRSAARRGSVLITPRQFGPIRAMPYSAQMSLMPLLALAPLPARPRGSRPR